MYDQMAKQSGDKKSLDLYKDNTKKGNLINKYF